jgi:rhodanese-related sulfurtransferase
VAALRLARGRLAGAEPTVPPPTPPAPAPPQLEPEDVAIDAFQVLRKQSVGYDFVFLDVREPDEWSGTGVIEGALAVPLGQLGRQIGQLDPEACVIAYCASGGRSTRAALLLREAGLTDAWSMAGGIRAWSREGGPLVPWPAADAS